MEKSIIKSSISILLVLSLMLFFLTGCSNNQETDLKTKAEDELVYFENKLLDIANKLNNITFANYTLKETTLTNSEESGNTESSQGKSSDSKNEESGGNSKKSGSSSEGESSNSEKNGESKESEVTEKYQMEPSSILTNKENKIDWEYIKYNTELLYSNWSTMVIDLHSLNVDSNDILNGGDTLNNLIIASKNEDKVQTLQILSDLYSYIPKYSEQCSDDTQKNNIQYTKYFIIDAYTLLEENKWDEMKKQMQNAKNYYLNIINSVDENQKNQNKINKIYVLLNELDNSIDYKDKELFYIKYKALMENIENL